MRNFTKIILALLILAGLVFVAQWRFTSPAVEKAKPTPESKFFPSVATALIKSPIVAAPKVAPAPAGDKNEPPLNSANTNNVAPPTQSAFKAKDETDFGVVELEDGVTTRLTLNSGGSCEIRPTALDDGSFKLVVILASPDPDTGEMMIATPTIFTPPGEPVWLGIGGKEDGEDKLPKLGVSFTPKLKNS